MTAAQLDLTREQHNRSTNLVETAKPLQEMEDRLRILEEMLAKGKEIAAVSREVAQVQGTKKGQVFAAGWSMVDEKWKECPIGIWRA